MDKNIHLIRILDEEHLTTLLGDEFRLNPEAYARDLWNMSEELRLGRPFKACWNGLNKFESVQATRLCLPANKEKFSSFLKFDWPWQEVHNLSLASFLPTETVFNPASLDPSPSGLRCIKSALEYFSEALACYLGGDGYDNAIRPLCDRMTDQSLNVVPISFVFHTINYQISCVLRNYVTGTVTLDWSCPDRSLVGSQAFLRELTYALKKAEEILPRLGHRNDMEINHFLKVVHDKITWSTKRALDDKDLVDEERKITKKAKNKARKERAKANKAAKSTGNKANEDKNKVAKAAFCVFAAAHLLKVLKKDGDPVKCGRSDCKLTHLKSFSSIKKADLTAASIGKLHGDTLSSFQAAVEALPASSFKS
jgi:hypothetical protein